MAYKLTKKQAEREAEELIGSEWRGRGLPIDPIYISRQLGAQVFELALSDEIDGMLKYFEDGKTPIIFVQKGAHSNRQRFTIAHEVGHLIANRRQNPLEENQVTDIFYRNQESTTGNNEIEVFANQFAAALLMPRRFLEEMVTRGKSDLILAQEFGVSLEAMKNRLQNLGLKPRVTSY